MSWLIEAYLEEGKHGPDHPESLNMKNMEDMKQKKIKEKEAKIEPSSKELKSMNGELSKHAHINAKYVRHPETDKAGKQAVLRGEDYEKGAQDFIKHKINNAPDKHNENVRAAEDMVAYKGGSRYSDATKAEAKSLRRHRDKEAANESVDMLVELM